MSTGLLDNPDIAERSPVAKKKAVPKAPPRQSSIIAIKGSDEFAKWLKDLADHAGLPMTNTIDQALKAYADKVGFATPMPKRLSR